MKFLSIDGDLVIWIIQQHFWVVRFGLLTGILVAWEYSDIFL
jgi:hypothetical protein